MPFLLRPLIEELVDQITRSTHVLPTDRPRIEIDVDPGQTVDADAGAVRHVLAALLESAVTAAACPDVPSDAPPLREVVVTSVATPCAVEVEIADSGTASPHTVDLTLATARGTVGRLGGSLRIGACPEGGRAVTVVLPRLAARRLAA